MRRTGINFSCERLVRKMGMSAPALFFSALVISLVAFQQQAHANLNVSPARTVFRVPAGQHISGSYKVENLSDETLEFTIEPEKFDKTDAPDPSEWFVMETNRVTIEPHQKLEIGYSGTVPESAAGELSLQVFFTTSSTSVRKRLGVVIYIPIVGTEQFDVQFKDIEIDYMSDPLDLPAKAQEARGGSARIPDRLVIKANLFNNGNTHVVPTGDVVIYNAADEQVAQFDISGGWGLLPNSQYPYTSNGIGVALQPGNYTARINVHYGKDVNQEQVVTKTVPFTVGNDFKAQVKGN